MSNLWSLSMRIKLINMNNEKRILKPLPQRKPKETVSYPKLVKKVAKSSKYRESDVKIVVDQFLKSIVEELEKKKAIRLPGIGILFPSIKPSRVGMALNGGVGKPTKVIVPDRWMVKFQPSRRLEQLLFGLSVSEEEVNALYKN